MGNIEPNYFNNSVFISYNHEDSEIAEKIFQQFKDKFIDVWLDNNNLRQGDELTKEIVDAINNSCCFIPIITNKVNENIMTKRYYKTEWNYVSQNKDKQLIFPIRTKEFNDQMPFTAGTFSKETIDLFLKDNPEILMRRQEISPPDYKLEDKFLTTIKELQFKSRMESLKGKK